MLYKKTVVIGNIGKILYRIGHKSNSENYDLCLDSLLIVLDVMTEIFCIVSLKTYENLSSHSARMHAML